MGKTGMDPGKKEAKVVALLGPQATWPLFLFQLQVYLPVLRAVDPPVVAAPSDTLLLYQVNQSAFDMIAALQRPFNQFIVS